MNHEEEIKKLQEELRQLYSQTQQQQQRIIELHNRLVQMGGQPVQPASKTMQPSNWISENFIGLRLIHLIGIVVLVIGLSIGVKYAIDRNLISELARISLAYGAGVVLYVLSYRLKTEYEAFSAILLSGAMATFYFTTYGAFVYYSMMPFAAAFAIMVGLTVFTTYQSIVYNRQEIALLGLVGAYGIPFLISQNSDRADLFFLYISLINLGVAFLAIKKQWRWVSRAAQAITWILFIGWAATRAEGVMMGIGTIYLIWFFLLFATMILSHKLFHKQALLQSDIYQFVTNNIACYVAGIMLYCFSFEDAEVATITFVFFMFNLLQALFLHFYLKEHYTSRMVGSFTLMLFILFIANKWEGLTVTLLWLLTAVALFAWGVMKRSSPARIAAIVLIGTTLLKLIMIDTITFNTVQKVISYIVLGILLLIVSFLYQKYRQKIFGEDR
jgi:uncharacterized membrane protein